jgi:hypothetical protein
MLRWVGVEHGCRRGLSAKETAARLEAELGEETIGDSMSGEEADAGLGTPAVGIHRDGRAVILGHPWDDAPVLEDARLLARLSRATRVVLFQLSERVNCGFFQVGCWVDGGHSLADHPLSRGARDRGIPGGRPAAAAPRAMRWTPSARRGRRWPVIIQSPRAGVAIGRHCGCCWPPAIALAEPR